MNLAINTLIFGPVSLESKLEACAKAGFEFVELWHDEVLEFGVSRSRALLRKLNLKVSSLEVLRGWFELDGGLMGVDDRESSIFEACRERMQIASDLECPFVIACPSFSHRGKFSSLEEGAQRYLRLLDLGDSLGVCPALEFMGQTGQINSLRKAVEFYNLVSDSRMKLVIDAYHIWRSGNESSGLDRIPSSNLALFHVSDAQPNIPRQEHRDRDRVLPGDGCINLKDFLIYANLINSEAVLSIGVYNPMYWDKDPILTAETAYIKTNNLLTEIE